MVATKGQTALIYSYEKTINCIIRYCCKLQLEQMDVIPVKEFRNICRNYEMQSSVGTIMLPASVKRHPDNKTKEKMNRILMLMITLVMTNFVIAQNKSKTDKADLKEVIKTFMTCLVKKDSVKFYNLFGADPVVWVGVFKDKTQQDRQNKDSTKKNYFVSNYKSFYRSISDLGTDEEKFYNIKIDNDESIATVSFDYSFWENDKKINWGKESWHLAKINDSWKITSVIFSMDFEKVNPEPQKRNK